MLAALGAALVLGILIAATGNEPGLRIADAVQPLGVLWVNAIRMTVIPLVVALLFTGITSVSGVGSMGRLGGRTLSVFLLLMIVSAVLTLVVAVSAFSIFPASLVGNVPVPPGAAEATAAVSGAAPASVKDFLLGLLPSNPVAAAASGDMVALIVFTSLVALAAARSDATTRAPLEAFFRSLGDVMIRLVGWIIALAPVAVFALLLPLAARAGTSLVGAVGFYTGVVAIAALGVTLAFYPVSRRGVAAFARATLPTQLIAASCASSIASLPAMMRSTDAMGVSPAVRGFVLPLAVSIFKPAAPVMWIVGALFIGRFYGVELTLAHVGTITLASIFVSFAAPGVPRGAFLLLTPLFEAVGLPAEGIGVLIAIDLIPDMFSTVVNVTGDMAAASLVDRFRSGATISVEPAQEAA